MLKLLFQRSKALTLALGIVAGVSLALVAATTSATPIISGLHLTGTEYPIGTAGGQDSYWEVYAFPTAYNGPLTPAGYQAWVFTGGSPPSNVPERWYPGISADPFIKGGSDNVGANGARWIGLQQDNADALYPGPRPALGAVDYSVIYRTTFQASSTGSASFALLTTADNGITFFVGGTVDNTNDMMPTMTGLPIAAEKIGLGSLEWVKGDASVVAGTNDLYAVVRDRFTIDPTNPNIGNYGQTGFLVAAVPEPSSFVLAALGGGVMAIGAIRRRLKRSA